MPVECPTCKKVISHQKHLDEHLRTHTGDKPFVCETCSEAFACKGNLRKHEKRKHLGVVYSCEKCHRQFDICSALSRHKKAAERYANQCDQCCSSFKKVGNLRNHKRDFHPKTEQDLQADDNPGINGDDEDDNKNESNQNIMSDGEQKKSTGSRDATTGQEVNQDSSTLLEGTQKEVIVSPRGVVRSSQGGRIYMTSSMAGKRKGAKHDAGEEDGSKARKKRSVADSAVADAVSMTDDAEVVTSKAVDDDGGVDFFERTPTDEDGVCKKTSRTRAQQQQQKSLEEANVNVESTKEAGQQDFTLFGKEEDRDLSDDFDISFVCRAWRLTKDKERLNKALDNFSKWYSETQSGNQNAIKKAVFSFLSGATQQLSIDEMISVLKEGPETLVGNFVTCLMIMEYMVNLSGENVMCFYERSNELAIEFELFVESVSAYILQGRIVEHYESNAMDTIPESLSHHLTLDLALLLTNKSGELERDDETNVRTRQEMKSLLAISARLDEYICSDLATNGRDEDNCASLLESSFTSVERAAVWSRLKNHCLNMLVDDTRESYFEVLLLLNLKHNLDTRPYFKTQSSRSVSFHAGVIKRYKGNSQDDISVHFVDATKDDVQTFTNLLYRRRCDKKLIKGKITTGVLNIAEHLQLVDIGYFLFRGNSYSSSMGKDNRRDVLHIMIHLKMDKELDEIARDYARVFPECERSRTLNGLPPEGVLFFLRRKSLHLDELDMYRILVQWSFHRAQKECLDELKTRCDEQVYENFKLVRSVLPLLRMIKHYDKIWQQQLITTRDIKAAKMMSMRMHEGTTSVSQDDVWFPTADDV